MRYFSIIFVFVSLLFLQGCQQRTAQIPSLKCDPHANSKCATALFEQSDKELSDIYQKVADTQEEEGVKRLAISQRNWFKFRDSYAEFVSMREIDAKRAELQLINQRLDMSLARIAELQKLLPADPRTVSEKIILLPNIGK